MDAHTEGIYVKVGEPVRIAAEFHPRRPRIRRLVLHWRERRYEITKIHFYHQERWGEALQHLLHVTANEVFFKLRFDGKKLQWVLEEYYEPH